MRPEFKQVHCPFLRTVLSAPDAPAWDAAAQRMRVDDLLAFVRAQPGDGTLDRVIRYFAVVNHGPGNRAQRLFHYLINNNGDFSTDLIGSDGDHGGDSRIYHAGTREFDPAEFAAFTKFSADGRRMTIAELGEAICDMNRRHQGSPSDALQSAGEFALLSILIGDRIGAPAISDMRMLYEANQFPPQARANLGSRTQAQWFARTAALGDAIAAAAQRTGHHAGALAQDQLRAGLRMVFGPAAGR